MANEWFTLDNAAKIFPAVINVVTLMDTAYPLY